MSTKFDESLRFLSPHAAEAAVAKYDSPLYVYSEDILRNQAKNALGFPAPYGLTVRYAMKANPLAGILRVFDGLGIGIDASSCYEVERAMLAGVDPKRIMLTSQEVSSTIKELVDDGVKFNATSVHQLEVYGKLFPGSQVSVRINSGLGSGHTRGASVAGPTSSFGIWHEHIDDIQRLVNRYKLQVTTIHNHIGCGTDPKIWIAAARKLLSLVDDFPGVETINLGGGFKVARTKSEAATDLMSVGQTISAMLEAYALKTGRKLHLEIEPGTYLVANAGTLLASVEDIVDTGSDGLLFAKLNTGMNDIMRPALHASQHPIVPVNARKHDKSYVVVGHNCESTDLLTPSPHEPETPMPRNLPELEIGDLVAIEGAGAYCSAMNLAGYNSFPSPSEVLLTTDSKFRLLKRRRNLDDLLSQEVDYQSVAN